MKPSLPIMRVLHANDYTDADSGVAALVEAFNRFQKETVDYLASLPQMKLGIGFHTDQFGAASVRVSHSLPNPPTFVTVGRVSRKNGAPLGSTYGWSSEWLAQGQEILLSFVDLPVSIDLLANVEMR